MVKHAKGSNLVHIITEDLCYNDDISRQYKRIYAQGNALFRKFYVYIICKMYFI